jgi:hypothetical protein
MASAAVTMLARIVMFVLEVDGLLFSTLDTAVLEMLKVQANVVVRCWSVMLIVRRFYRIALGDPVSWLVMLLVVDVVLFPPSRSDSLSLLFCKS